MTKDFSHLTEAEIIRRAYKNGAKLKMPKSEIEKTIREILGKRKIQIKRRREINIDTRKKGDMTATISKTKRRPR